MVKPRIVLFGSTGTSGSKVFQELWKRKDEFQLAILTRPSKKNKRLYKSFEKSVGIKSISGTGVVEKNGFKIVWGDITNLDDVKQVVTGANWVLNCSGLISPLADYRPEQAYAVNTIGVKNIVTAIESESHGSDNIRLIHMSSVATTGDRMGSVRYGRVGDPVYPSIYDYYGVTKIAAERVILESSICYWAILRVAFILPTKFSDVFSLLDPILFHMPLDACLEASTDRDVSHGILNTLSIPEESSFWKRVHNYGGGPKMRATAYNLVNLALGVNGISGVEAIADRNYFALRNFHLVVYEDSEDANEYLHHQRDSLEKWQKAIINDMPWILKSVRKLSKKLPLFQKLIDRVARGMMRKLAVKHRNGTRFWYLNRKDKRITAYFKDYETYESIPDWNTEKTWESIENMEKIDLTYGFDKTKSQLEIMDLQNVAIFRGGKLLSSEWDGDMYSKLDWECCLSHRFTSKPSTILKAGHWCPICAQPPWNQNKIAKKNPFFAQVWYETHDKDENEVYTLEECEDIRNAHLD